jgi:hypothetical protein
MKRPRTRVAGTRPRLDFRRLRIASGRYADLYSSEWVGMLRGELAADCVALGIDDVDACTIQRAAPHRIRESQIEAKTRKRFEKTPEPLRGCV